MQNNRTGDELIGFEIADLSDGGGFIRLSFWSSSQVELEYSEITPETGIIKQKSPAIRIECEPDGGAECTELRFL